MLFDPDLIRYDEHYCTTVVDLSQVTQLPTAEYFHTHVFPHLHHEAHVIDIGCGQGEFVNQLRRYELRASGYDPVLRVPTPGLHSRLWTAEEPPADLYVMRCVLPHIPEPWNFLQLLEDSSPGCLALIEYQRIEWAIERNVWAQLSHDHVNLFTLEDFKTRFDVLDHGTFSGDEWAWVLIRPGTHHQAPPTVCTLGGKLDALVENRLRDIGALVELGCPIVVWGAAGKGTVLCHALWTGKVDVQAIDADPRRWHRHLETSGVQILPPAQIAELAKQGCLVIVANPNHLPAVRKSCGQGGAVASSVSEVRLQMGTTRTSSPKA
jgi:hypothetical protein